MSVLDSYHLVRRGPYQAFRILFYGIRIQVLPKIHVLYFCRKLKKTNTKYTHIFVFINIPLFHRRRIKTEEKAKVVASVFILHQCLVPSISLSPRQDLAIKQTGRVTITVCGFFSLTSSTGTSWPARSAVTRILARLAAGRSSSSTTRG